jgi:hypothetical protein
MSSKQRCEENLHRLRQDLTAYTVAQSIPIDAAKTASSHKIADSIFLAHSTSADSFDKICQDGARLLSPAQLDKKGVKPLKPDAVEIVLDTTGYVFFYAAPFSFPSSAFGLLFAKSLEEADPDIGFASPFDSGGLAKCFQRPDMTEPPREFFLRHELPVPSYRAYLQESIGALFDDPFDYVAGAPPRFPGPIGLSGGECRRRHAHEVRIPDEVRIRSPHLKAIFHPLRWSVNQAVENLLVWAKAEGFDVVSFDADRQNVFEKLRSACIHYLRNNLT